MKNYAITMGLALLLMLSSSTYAAAQSAYGGAESSAETSAGVSGVVNSNFGTGVKGVINALIGADATTSASSGSSPASGSGSANSESSPSVNANIPGSLEVIVITRADVEAGTAAPVNVSPASVRSDADLSGFVASQISADKNISEVETSADNVSVTYKQKARLFGFIPVTVNARATVHSDGSVDVRYPWYAFLMVTNESDLEALIENRVEALVSADATASADASLQLTAATQAQLISEIQSVMESELAADAAANVSAAVDAAGSVNVE